jgi:16S rRNA (cytidine1402-2'-O)-methyltransferase
MFAGFIPNKDKARFDLFNELKDINTTLVLYETANRIEKSLTALKAVMANREIAVVREISKIYEETISGTIDEVLEKLHNNPIKGEIVLIIAPSFEESFNEIDVDALLREELRHSTLKEAVKKVCENYHLKRNDVYEKALQIKNNG